MFLTLLPVRGRTLHPGARPSFFAASSMRFAARTAKRSYSSAIFSVASFA
jgi:hypothetical protein